MKIFRGTHKEIGSQIGFDYKSKGTTLGPVKIKDELFNKQKNIYKKYYPEKLEQLIAIAEAAGFDVDLFVYRNICSEIDWYREMTEGRGCTIFGVENDEGVFVGRNYDWKPGTEKYFEVFKSYNTDAFSYIGITDMDYWSKAEAKKRNLFYDIDDAINEHGLYIGLTFAYADQWNYGISPIHFNQLVAEKCKTVDEALGMFKRVPLACPKNFFIADKNGKMRVVESTSRKHEVIEPLNGILIQTNHFIHPELAKEDTLSDRSPLNNTFKRYAEALEQLTAKKQNIHEIGVEKILSKPKSEILENHRKMKTIWSLSLDMKKGIYRIYWDFEDGEKEERRLELEDRIS